MSEIKYSYGKQTISEDDIAAVVKTLKSDWLTQGPEISRFEVALCSKFGSKHASALASGTAGLHLIALASEWGTGDVVLTTPITFLASANCIVYAGATPDFVDIDPKYYTLDANALETKVKRYQQQGKRVKAVIAVDFAGQPCDWEALKDLAEKFEFQLVNDNCHALGASYKGDTQYAVKYAYCVNMSFHPVKNITTGEGGAVLTNDDSYCQRINMLRTHGMTKDCNLLLQNDGPWYYEMQELGYNYRITDFQCALGFSQLKKLDQFVAKRREIARYYDELLGSDKVFIIPDVADYTRHAYHLYPLQIRFDQCRVSKKELFQRMRDMCIALQVHYIPIHLQPYYKKHYGFKEGDFPVSEGFYTQEISMPIYPNLELNDISFIVSALRESIGMGK